MLQSRARRIPVVDIDDETKRTMVVSVITQYRILKFIAVNVKETQKLRKPLKEMNIGTYTDIATCFMDTPVMDVIHLLVKRNISSVPIVYKQGMLRSKSWEMERKANETRYRTQCLRICRCDRIDQGRIIR